MTTTKTVGATQDEQDAVVQMSVTPLPGLLARENVVQKEAVAVLASADSHHHMGSRTGPRQEGTSASQKEVTKGAKDDDAPPGSSRGTVILDLALSAPSPVPVAVPAVSRSSAGRVRPEQYNNGADAGGGGRTPGVG